ncbi:MAG: hypothetical protein KDA88_06485 [Planctomycetaceae bacterium]|nr:hypothetical protein [Planctomycetaceae bacterium]
MRILRILCLLMAFALATPGFGQEVGPGNVTFSPVWDATRSHAPRFLDVQVNWPLTQLLEGNLEVENYRDSKLLSRWESYETAITSPGQTLKLTLPPTLVESDRQRHIYRVQFHGRDRTIYLDEHDRPSEMRWKRSMVVGVVADRDTAVPTGLLRDADSIQLAASVKLEDYIIVENPEDVDDLRGWQQHVTTVPPAKLPDDPLQFLAFDILLASTEQIATLDDGKLEALRLWTEGGGSLGISIAEPVPQRLESWLNEIAGGTRINKVLSISSGGGVQMLSRQNATGPHLAYPGVGRSVIVQAPLMTESVSWRQAVWHLWKVRPSQIVSAQRRRRFQFTRRSDWAIPPQRYADPHPWDPNFDTTASVMTNLLIPSQVSGVPLWIVCSVLGICLLIVVPGDYLILGTLKLRRWTWLAVPVVAIGSTWYMVRTANSYMGNQDHSQTLTFVDMNQELEPVRWNRFELLFPATTKELSRQVNRVFEVDLGEGNSGQEATLVAPDPDWGTRDEFGRFADEVLAGELRIKLSRTDVPNYTGSIPVDYTVKRRVNQWTPRVIRQTTFQPFTDVDTSWLQSLPSLAEWPSLEADPVFYRDLQMRIGEQFGRCQILYWDNTNSQEYGKWLSEATNENSPRLMNVADYVTKQTNRTDNGLFRILGQVSPLATELTEDLAIAPDNDVVVIITANADESAFTAWRFVIAR